MALLNVGRPQKLRHLSIHLGLGVYYACLQGQRDLVGRLIVGMHRVIIRLTKVINVLTRFRV